MSTPSENIMTSMNNTDAAIRKLFKNTTGRDYKATIENIQDFRESVTREKQEEMNALLEQMSSLHSRLRRVNPTGVLGPGNMALGAKKAAWNLQSKKSRRHKKNRKTRKSRR